MAKSGEHWHPGAAYLYVLHLDGPALAWEYLRRHPTTGVTGRPAVVMPMRQHTGGCACWKILPWMHGRRNRSGVPITPA